MATKKKRLGAQLDTDASSQASWIKDTGHKAPKGTYHYEGGQTREVAGRLAEGSRYPKKTPTGMQAKYRTSISKKAQSNGGGKISVKQYSDYIGSTSKKTGNNPARQYETVGRWDEKNHKINWGLEPKKSDVGRAARNESGYFSKEKLMRSAEKGGVVSTVKKQTARYLSDDPVQRREVAGKARVSSAHSAHPSKTGFTAKGYAVREKNRRLKNKMRNK